MSALDGARRAALGPADARTGRDWARLPTLCRGQLGGNRRALEFMSSQPDFKSGMSIRDKYNTRAATLYREKVWQRQRLRAPLSLSLPSVWRPWETCASAASLEAGPLTWQSRRAVRSPRPAPRAPRAPRPSPVAPVS